MGLTHPTTLYTGIERAEAAAVMATIRCKACGYYNLPEARFCANCASSLTTTSFQPAPTVTSGEEPVTREVPVEFMGFWIRFGAFAIDCLILILAIWILRLIPGVFAFSFILPLLYFWLFTGIRGQTPGKTIFEIKVIDIHNNIPGLGRAALREIVGKFILLFVFLITLLGFIWIAMDSEKQGWHDKIAGTYVIRATTRRR